MNKVLCNILFSIVCMLGMRDVFGMESALADSPGHGPSCFGDLKWTEGFRVRNYVIGNIKILLDLSSYVSEKQRQEAIMSFLADSIARAEDRFAFLAERNNSLFANEYQGDDKLFEEIGKHDACYLLYRVLTDAFLFSEKYEEGMQPCSVIQYAECKGYKDIANGFKEEALFASKRLTVTPLDLCSEKKGKKLLLK